MASTLPPVEERREEELLAYIKVAKAAQNVAIRGRGILAEEAEALAGKVDRTAAAASTMALELKTRRRSSVELPAFDSHLWNFELGNKFFRVRASRPCSFPPSRASRGAPQ